MTWCALLLRRCVDLSMLWRVRSLRRSLSDACAGKRDKCGGLSRTCLISVPRMQITRPSTACASGAFEGLLTCYEMPDRMLTITWQHLHGGACAGVPPRERPPDAAPAPAAPGRRAGAAVRRAAAAGRAGLLRARRGVARRCRGQLGPGFRRGPGSRGGPGQRAARRRLQVGAGTARDRAAGGAGGGWRPRRGVGGRGRAAAARGAGGGRGGRLAPGRPSAAVRPAAKSNACAGARQ